MQEITVYDKYEKPLTHLTQWDKNVVIHFKNAFLDKATYVHFFNCNSKKAMVRSATYENGALYSQVPNDILMEPNTIIGYIWVDEKPDDIDYKSSEHKSVYCFRIMVKKCPQPSDQVYMDQKEFITFDRILSYEKGYSLLSQSYAVGNSKSRTGEDTDNAKYYFEQSKSHAQAASDSAQTADTYARAASNSEQNAAAFSDNAKTSETNAALSESTATSKATAAATSAANAKTSETNAASSAKIAKTSETNAATSATNAATSASNSKEYLKKMEETCHEAAQRLKEATEENVPGFQVDFSTGHLLYKGGRFMFQVNKAGHLEWGLMV